MQAQLEERMSLLSTQDGVANLSVDSITPGPNGDFGLGQSPEQGTGSYRRLSTQTSPVLCVRLANPTLAPALSGALLLTRCYTHLPAATQRRARQAEPTLSAWTRHSRFSRRCSSASARVSRLGRRR
jgi:hypothetical protein